MADERTQQKLNQAQENTGRPADAGIHSIVFKILGFTAVVILVAAAWWWIYRN